MPRLPRGVFVRPDRPGYYIRDRRGGKDRWRKAGETTEQARRFRDRVTPGGDWKLTVGKAAGVWLDRSVRLSRNEAGLRLAEQRVRAHLVPALGHRPVSRLTADDCRGYRIALEAREPRLSPQTVRHLLSDLRCFLGWAEGEGLLDRSPFPRRLMPRIQERPPDRLSEEECAELVTLPEPWGFYLRLLLGTGIRWGEASRAEAQHIERGHLVVPQTKTFRVRRVPIPPDLEAEIRGRVGRLLHVVNAQNVANQARNVVPRFHVHMTRHTFACRWLESGGSITALQEILGHSSVVTTQRYGRPSENSIRREAEKAWTG